MMIYYSHETNCGEAMKTNTDGSKNTVIQPYNSLPSYNMVYSTSLKIMPFKHQSTNKFSASRKSEQSALLPALIIGLVIMLTSVCALAQDNADIAAGKQYFYTCTGCHGIPDYNNAYPTYKVPMVGGQNELYIINALQAYKNGTRQHETMQVQAESMTQQDIINVAAYLASMNRKESS